MFRFSVPALDEFLKENIYFDMGWKKEIPWDLEDEQKDKENHDFSNVLIFVDGYGCYEEIKELCGKRKKCYYCPERKCLSESKIMNIF